MISDCLRRGGSRVLLARPGSAIGSWLTILFLLLIQVLAHWLGLLPASSSVRADSPFFVLPARIATLMPLAYIARVM